MEHAVPPVWVDADGCPRKVRAAVREIVTAFGTHAVFVSRLVLPDKVVPPSRLERVLPRSDAADDYIIEMARAGEVVVTQDIGLAFVVAKAGATVIHTHGFILRLEEATEWLFNRDTKAWRRSVGYLKPQRRGPFSADDLDRFRNAITSVLSRSPEP